MPWVSEFGYALHMAETGKRIMVGDGTVRRYVDSVHSGVLSLDDLPDNLVLEDPRAGRIEGRRELESFMEASSRWLAERDARIEWVASTVGEGRAVGELVIHLTLEQMSLSLPIAVMAERGSNRAEFRVYYSQWPLLGSHTRRPPILEEAGVDPQGSGSSSGSAHRSRAVGDGNPHAEPSAQRRPMAISVARSSALTAGRIMKCEGVDCLGALERTCPTGRPRRSKSPVSSRPSLRMASGEAPSCRSGSIRFRGLPSSGLLHFGTHRRVRSS